MDVSVSKFSRMSPKWKVQRSTMLNLNSNSHGKVRAGTLDYTIPYHV